MRPTRLIYVENDPALRGIMSSLLAAEPALELLFSAGGADEALARPEVLDADVALLDLALGAHQMTGIDLGIALRERNENLGIVIHSQHDPQRILHRFPAEDRMGWFLAPKRGDLSMAELVTVLRSAARGLVGEPATAATGNTIALSGLSDRQRAVMALAAEGLGAPAIARLVGRSADSVRQDLSRAYAVLLPEIGEGEDRRTRAVIEYLRQVREEAWEIT